LERFDDEKKLLPFQPTNQQKKTNKRNETWRFGRRWKGRKMLLLISGLIVDRRRIVVGETYLWLFLRLTTSEAV
jgi:hypothetical protein